MSIQTTLFLGTLRFRIWQFSFSLLIPMFVIVPYLFVCSISGCTNKRVEQMFFLEWHGFDYDSVKVKVNGEPALDGSLVRYFILPGINTLSVEGAIPESEGRPGWFSLYEGPYRDQTAQSICLWKLIDSGEAHKRRVVSGDFSFRVEGGLVWKWGEADSLTEVTERDILEIKSLYRDYMSLLMRREASFRDIASSGIAVPWTSDEVFIKDCARVYDRHFSFLRTYMEEQLDMTCKDPDDLRYERGNRLVMARSIDGEELIDVSVPPELLREGEVSFRLSIRWVFFSRFSGQWKILML